MLNNLLPLIDLVFPPRPQTLVVRSCSSSMVLAQYCPGTYNGVAYLSSYESEIMQALIQENKYFKNKTAATLLSLLLARWLEENQIQAGTTLIPVPLGKKRYAERGYNQVHQIVRQLPSVPSYVLSTRLLMRHRDTPSQTTLLKNERTKNVAGAFSVNQEHLRHSQEHQYIIVDDVVTTGATLQAAKSTLRDHLPVGSTVRCVAIAH